MQEFHETVFKTVLITDFNQLNPGEPDEYKQKNSLSFSSNSHSHALFAPLKSSGTHDQQRTM